ncbi:hypothetical protein [Pantoea agglomerans]|jgi:hypothetical protein|uniref:Uncharacterized protein n=1 Tax=Enterobacter agglomerans TaxID=549 RepID=A0A7X2MJ55_ENTAG|nr:hypothetical protein [Pantoea agglomerans]AYP22833.1 hypothetical protein D0A61_07650 [Pantoea agglomerans]MSE14212.1 hypothetical protein [Pantoea agglomerans]NKE95563.1 hypothetical protein [Pantoea agglomerans]RAH34193.1 hypothetical protein DOT37_08205 [Pantoea agglomerans]TGX94412.1 hypothetical protein E5821_08190 [Pantoea agglomerans]
MRSDQEIYNDIGSVLLSVAPENASKIIMRADLSPENDHCRCEFDYISVDTGDTGWFSAGAQANGDLFDLLVELRNYFVDTFKSQEKPFWHSCEVTVNVETLKINIDFKYDQ